ncbi:MULTISPECIES: Gfo/Idh/MocA family protein [Ensifer]|uniref:Gfo/Idh/MocA family oxidoreductase n=1 Tax=Ensifer adhaerens TaxID=106592 RepID=A0A9Q9DDT4_ENSAD|nr:MULTISPECIES: Gfo/Idh/MocA family oxidoreductase [Ensifer]KQX52541.1 oxidoreductase [Ensifer sp. Root1298]KQX85386.1 oxidoreductase [Ensifer sp. Root1312]KRC18933.1 oxidoreductase [Ensifer sp. Root74]KRD76745.1 oxidoreductase [Ensifer sp. Root954]USJ27745.1 Gfo/Idh/MocA family oxidoreductase [Ensifer adhaerens]
MPAKQERRLRVGVLGAGQIAQAAHFEACTKAANADLYAICDVADDLRERMVITHGAQRSYNDYDRMLADPELDAVIIATADAFHVPASIRALEAGKHVLCEKPVGVTVEECFDLKSAVQRSGKVLQVGHMKRFDAGLQAAKSFIRDEMGDMIALKAWYCDNTHRYPMTDAVQPLIVTSSNAKRPSTNPKADLRRYYMLAHGCHLIDTARYFAGDIVAVNARLSERSGIWCWFVDVEFASGTLGHLDLTVQVRMDWHEGFQIYGKNGSILGKTYNPWYYKSSEVDIFREADGATHRVLGADGHFYRRQVEGFARSVLDGAILEGANIDDGVASVQAMVAIARSAETGKRVALADVSGGV